MDYGLVSLILLGVLVIAYGISTYVNNKTKNNSTFDLESYLSDFTEDVIRITKTALGILKLDPKGFDSEIEFRQHLIEIVTKEFRKFLEEEAKIPNNILKLLTEEFLIEFVGLCINLYEDEVTDKFRNDLGHEPSSFAESAMEEKKEEDTEGRTNVTSVIHDFYNE